MNKLVLNIKPKTQWFPHFYLLGCEAVAVSMGLKYKGVKLSTRKILNEIPKHKTNPYKGYVGPKRIIKPDRHQTVFPNVMVDYLSQYYKAVDSTGQSMAQLEEAIMNNHSVVLYATHFKIEPIFRKFKVEGEIQEFVSNIHIALLVGMDNQYYYIIDPLWAKFGFIKIPAIFPMKQQLMKVKRRTLEKRYENAGRMSIII
ncbi:C39 family peptidase [Macrococcus capreoli]|uniref:C39 family peptidase n=1 Tax=Macrococcus capreoli TaxID=2982690 RepID=UPI0021D5A64A|nr:C39 family peptidase [Macrococcus sp. TMW 2.2395]MCU7556960.1 C39 family peptidase [Macrococcus sp. TMW 2.2395]